MTEPEKPPSEESPSPATQKPLLPDFLTVDETAEALRCSLAHAYRLFHRGALGGFRDGARVLVWKQSLVDYVTRGAKGPAVRRGRGRPRKARA